MNPEPGPGPAGDPLPEGEPRVAAAEPAQAAKAATAPQAAAADAVPASEPEAAPAPAPEATPAPAAEPPAAERRGPIAAGLALSGRVASAARRGLRWLVGRLPRIRSRRGRIVLLFMVAGFASAITIGGVAAVQWTETADFCGRCHTMGPELKGHEISAHRELACAECHVAPGVEGWVRAKLNGTKQLIQVLTGTFPTPIPPPGHGDLPPTSATCRRCHDVNALIANGGPIQLILRTRFQPDEKNTRSNVALVLRPAGFGGTGAAVGIHWHIQSDVEFSSSDPRNQTIDLVRVTKPDGSTEEFITNDKITSRTNVQPDVDAIVATESTVRMDCIDCHNRAGHAIPTLDDAVDSALSAGTIDVGLPYIKQQAVAALAGDYPSDAEAEVAIDGIRAFYQQEYPLVAQLKAQTINTSISQVKVIYQLVATPEMKVGAATYPNNLGHQSSPGCFRCHDGLHYLVENGVATDEVIPSGCATCHTFPEIGANTSAILIGERPSSHDDTLWVFNHKSAVTTLDPAGTTCGACHTRTYCENCHNTPAVQVPHDDMVFNHAAVVLKTGVQACAFCHQPAYCERCHAKGIMGTPGG
jgi:nitrate/TMAO reductase-like tetraheme cytochrome c subunit